MVLGCDDDVFGSGSFDGLYPGIGVEFIQSELRGIFSVFFCGHFAEVHDPFGTWMRYFAFIFSTHDGVGTDVDEDSETGVPPPLHALVAVLRGHVGEVFDLYSFGRGDGLPRKARVGQFIGLQAGGCESDERNHE